MTMTIKIKITHIVRKTLFNSVSPDYNLNVIIVYEGLEIHLGISLSI